MQMNSINVSSKCNQYTIFFSNLPISIFSVSLYHHFSQIFILLKPNAQFPSEFHIHICTAQSPSFFIESCRRKSNLPTETARITAINYHRATARDACLFWQRGQANRQVAVINARAIFRSVRGSIGARDPRRDSFIRAETEALVGLNKFDSNATMAVSPRRGKP